MDCGDAGHILLSKQTVCSPTGVDVVWFAFVMLVRKVGRNATGWHALFATLSHY